MNIKKYLLVFFTVFIAIAVIFSLSSCGDPYHFKGKDQYGNDTYNNDNDNDDDDTNSSYATTLASSLRAPSSLALYGDYVYWTDYYEHKIYRVKKTGGSVETIVKSGLKYPYVIQIFNTYIYVGEADPTQPDAQVNSIKRMGVDPGADPVVLYDKQYPIGGLTVDFNNVYWTEDVLKFGTVKQAKKEGGGLITSLITGLNKPDEITLYNGLLYFTEEGTSPDGVNSSGDGTVRKVSIGGASSLILASNLYFPASVSVNSTYAFFCEAGVKYGTTNLGSIKKSNINTEGAISIMKGADRISSIEFDPSNNYIYYNEGNGLNTDTGYIRKISISGDNKITIADKQVSPGDIEVDSTYVYWIQEDWSGNNASIMRKRK